MLKNLFLLTSLVQSGVKAEATPPTCIPSMQLPDYFIENGSNFFKTGLDVKRAKIHVEEEMDYKRKVLSVN